MIFRRRVDLRILPLLGVLYAFSLIDRTNLGVARILGLGQDLVCLLSSFIEASFDLCRRRQGLLVGSRYSIVSCLYFVPYILLWAHLPRVFSSTY